MAETSLVINSAADLKLPKLAFGSRRHREEEKPLVEASEEYPFTWTPISSQEKSLRREIYYSNGPWCVSPRAPMLDLVRSKPGRVLMPRAFAQYARQMYEFEVRPDDVFVVTYPKCGTTWTQEMVWQILHGFEPEGGQVDLRIRSPFLEMQALTSDADLNAATGDDALILNSLTTASQMSSPRVIKTHLPIDMLPPNLLGIAKVVFVARNPADCCVSFFHHERLVPKQGFAGTFDQYAKLFRKGNNPSGDYFYHLMSGWSRRSHPNLEFLWFEDMKRDLGKVIGEMCKFLQVDLSEEKRKLLESHLHIDNFRKNKAVNMESSYSNKPSEGGSGGGSFIRSGRVGGWREFFSEERMMDWRGWLEAETSNTGLRFTMDADQCEQRMRKNSIIPM